MRHLRTTAVTGQPEQGKYVCAASEIVMLFGQCQPQHCHKTLQRCLWIFLNDFLGKNDISHITFFVPHFIYQLHCEVLLHWCLLLEIFTTLYTTTKNFKFVSHIHSSVVTKKKILGISFRLTQVLQLTLMPVILFKNPAFFSCYRQTIPILFIPH